MQSPLRVPRRYAAACAGTIDEQNPNERFPGTRKFSDGTRHRTPQERDELPNFTPSKNAIQRDAYRIVMLIMLISSYANPKRS